jgi:putative oxygen-independent coproporphyrinogen III oxidase
VVSIEPELSLYLHFPFCKRKCYYCDFNSYSGIDELIPEYINALISEMKGFRTQQRLIKSVYFGGGTPSCIPAELLINLLAFMKDNFFINPATEVTIEANPGTIDLETLIMLYEAGFNRLSLGLQATQDDLLKAVGRIHSWQEFLTTYEQAREVGFANIGIDLICGLPGQSIGAWQDALLQVVKLNPEHISAYALQLEPQTPLAGMIEDGALQLPVEDEVAAMMQLTMDYLRENGYQHYEISNYARPGFCSLHNLGYWSGRNYLGFGAGAASMYHRERWTNIKNPAEYIGNVKAGKSAVAEREIIDHSIAITEAIMLGLRMRSGIDLRKLKENLQIDLKSQAFAELERFINQGLLKMDDGRLALTDRGVLISNYVIAGLLAGLN